MEDGKSIDPKCVYCCHGQEVLDEWLSPLEQLALSLEED
jgi:hypothetical protein